MKYVTTKEVFSEVPDEITLAIEISNCPCHCEGCHSSYLAQDIGEQLTEQSLFRLIGQHPIISCIALMGGDAEPSEVARLMRIIKEKTTLKTCWYSGRDLDRNCAPLPYLDYIKVGPFIPEYGPLDARTTNQRFYTVDKSTKELKNLTFRFWKH